MEAMCGRTFVFRTYDQNGFPLPGKENLIPHHFRAVLLFRLETVIW